MKTKGDIAKLPVVLLLGVLAAAASAGEAPAPAVPRQATPETVAAFDRYVQLTEARIAKELRKDGPYLWVDLEPAPARTKHLEQLRLGEVVVASLKTLDDEKEIECPDGLIHHWIATVFLPGITLDRYLAFVQDYDRHQEYFGPYVQRSRLLERKGDDFRVFFRFNKKKVTITAVHDTDHDIHYFRLSPTRGGSVTKTTKILDVENAGEKDERPRSAEEDRGYLWRLYTWWRFEERDGGLYVQCESVSLSRDIPWGLGWLVGPYVKSIPRESLTFILTNTRTALVKEPPTRVTQ